MSFLNTIFLGARLWIWLYFLFSLLMGIAVIIVFFRERIKKKYYELRYPEKLIKVVMHYKSGMFKEFWRIIPDDDIIKVNHKTYSFSDKHIQQPPNSFLMNRTKEKDGYSITIEKKIYDLKNKHIIKKRWRMYPEVHYLFNVPTPIIFNVTSKKIELSAKQLEEFNENNLFAKLLTSERDKKIMSIIILVVGANLIGTAFIIAKMMEWIK